MKTVTIKIEKEELVLMAQKCLYWPSIQALVISDLHLGKSSHFRKAGIPLSMGSYKDDLERISTLITQWTPKKIIFLGDLFHSDHNIEWEFFIQWITQYPGLEFVLIEGNHDLLTLDAYSMAGITLVESIQIKNILLSHEPLVQKDGFNIYGHIHPGIRLVGKAKQSVRIPCFYMGKNFMILPAFGSLTGLYTIEPKQHEMVYGVAQSSLIRYEPQGHNVING